VAGVAGNDRTPQLDSDAPSVDVVDQRKDVRDFLTSRRARITPQQAGLSIYGGNRRVAGLRREEVALLAGVSIDYYTRLERGNLQGVSERVLDARGRCSSMRPSGITSLTWPGPPTPHPAVVDAQRPCGSDPACVSWTR
jgi:Helix-turn-helix domain